MHSYHSYVFLMLASTLMSTNRLTWPNKRQIWTCMQSKLQSGTEPEYMHSLSYDPVSVWPRIRQSEFTLALYSSWTSVCFKVNTRILSLSRLLSWGDNVLVERSTTHLELSIVIWFWSSAICFCWSCTERIVYFFKWHSFISAISLE